MRAEDAIGKGFRFRMGKRGSQIYDSARIVGQHGGDRKSSFWSLARGNKVKLTQYINTETGWTETTRTVKPETEITRVK